MPAQSRAPFQAASWRAVKTIGNGHKVSFSPCGMAMDVLRSCYPARMRFDETRPDLWTDIEWFWCLPGAKVFPGYHRFASTHYDSQLTQTDQSLGEEEQDFPPWRRGDPPAIATGQQYCGDIKKFQHGVNLTHGPYVMRDSSGLPVCCGGVPDPGWRFVVKDGPHWTVLSPFKIRIDWEDSTDCGGLNFHRQTGSAEFLYESPSDQTVEVTFTGRIETQDPGFDGVTLSLNDEEVYNHFSTEAGGECDMEDFEESIDLDFKKGLNLIRVDFDSVDNRFHVGGFWEVEFVLP